MKAPDVGQLFDLHRTAHGHAIKQQRDVRVPHAHASEGYWLPDKVFFMGAMDVDKAAPRIHAAAAVDPDFQTLKPEYAGEHPVRAWRASTDLFIEHFACPPAASKNCSQWTSSADLETDTMRAVRSLQRSLTTPESPRRSRHRKAKHLAGAEETNKFLPGNIQVEALDLRHWGSFR